MERNERGKKNKGQTLERKKEQKKKQENAEIEKQPKEKIYKSSVKGKGKSEENERK